MVSNHSSTVSFTTSVASAKALKFKVRPWQESRKALAQAPRCAIAGLCADTMEAQGPGVREWGTLFCPLLAPPPPLLAATGPENLALRYEWLKIPASGEKDVVTAEARGLAPSHFYLLKG